MVLAFKHNVVTYLQVTTICIWIGSLSSERVGLKAGLGIGNNLIKILVIMHLKCTISSQVKKLSGCCC